MVQKMKVIGITGGIGSGKSTVARILGELGARVIDADIISKDIMYKGSKALQEITECFGNEILNEAEELDRKKLGDLVFGDAEKLEKLTVITHKYIIEEIIERVEREKSKAGTEMIILEASIPVEHGFKDIADEIWVVISDIEDRIKRVMNRNGYNYAQVSERINSQMSDEEYIKIADKVIKNSGKIDELKNEINKLL
jgi:dephospho-CoA kinase